MNTLAIKKVTISNQVFDTMIDQIEKGIWTPGMKLPNEIDLAAQFEVSRNIMREAMKVLENYGVLDSKTGKGTFVSEEAITNIFRIRFFDMLKSNQSIEKCLETRLIIEPELAYYAAIRCTDDEIRHLKSFVPTDSQTDNKVSVTNLNFDFHSYIAKISRNDILENLVCSILTQLQSGIYNEYSKYDSPENLKSADDHYEIVCAIEQRNPIRAKRIMRQHIFTRINRINSTYNLDLEKSKKKLVEDS